MDDVDLFRNNGGSKFVFSRGPGISALQLCFVGVLSSSIAMKDRYCIISF